MRPEEKLFDAVTGIDEEIVDSAQTYVFRKQTRPWQRAASLAACLLIVASIGFGILQWASIGGMGGSDSAANGSAADNSATGDSAAPEDGGLSGGADLPDGVAEGAVVEITFDGMVRESYPAQISGVTEILLAGE